MLPVDAAVTGSVCIEQRLAQMKPCLNVTHLCVSFYLLHLYLLTDRINKRGIVTAKPQKRKNCVSPTKAAHRKICVFPIYSSSPASRYISRYPWHSPSYQKSLPKIRDKSHRLEAACLFIPVFFFDSLTRLWLHTEQLYRHGYVV